MVYGLEWLTGSSTPKVDPVRAKSGDGGYVAPDRSARERCYESRDLFFECLDANDILDANKHDAESRQKCPTEVADYEKDCAKSWIKYFKEKRVMEYNRDATIANIKKEDAEMAAKSRADKKKSGGGRGGWFS